MDIPQWSLKQAKSRINQDRQEVQDIEVKVAKVENSEMLGPN